VSTKQFNALILIGRVVFIWRHSHPLSYWPHSSSPDGHVVSPVYAGSGGLGQDVPSWPSTSDSRRRDGASGSV